MVLPPDQSETFAGIYEATNLEVRDERPKSETADVPPKTDTAVNHQDDKDQLEDSGGEDEEPLYDTDENENEDDDDGEADDGEDEPWDVPLIKFDWSQLSNKIRNSQLLTTSQDLLEQVEIE